MTVVHAQSAEPPAGSFAEGNLRYIPTSGTTCAVNGYESAPKGEMIIPETVKNGAYTVTSIISSAFQNCKALTAVTMPCSMNLIGPDAFRGCSSLTSVTLSDGLTDIQSSAFAECTSLTEISIPGSVLNVRLYAFSGCESLKSVTFESGTEGLDINNDAFLNCNITDITFGRALGDNGSNTTSPFKAIRTLETVTFTEPANCLPIGYFMNCTGLSSVILPESLQTIGAEAFENCTALGRLTIPGSVSTVETGAFAGCTGIRSLTIADGHEPLNLPADAFTGCDIVSLTLGRNISTPTFAGYTSINTLNITEAVTSLCAGLFRGCTGLTEVTVPGSVTSFGLGAFAGCTGVTDVVFEPGDEPIEMSDVAFADSHLNSLTFSRKLSSTTIPFANRTYLKTLTVGAPVSEIRDGAFSGCASLSTVNLPNTLTSIGRNAFRGCSSLTEVTLPGSVTSIGARAFDRCDGIAKVTIENGEGPISIHETAFSSDIREVYIGRDMAESPFAGQTELSDVAFGNNVTSIPSYAFEGCGKLSRLNLPESLSDIGAYAFAECTSLTEVTIPGNVNSIGNGAFQQCSLLTKVAISNGSGMLATGNETFQHSPLQMVYMGRDMTGYPFSGHGTLTELTIGEGVTSIADNAFSGCTGLSALNLPPSVAKIGANAFAGCTGLSSPLTIPSSITHIGASAFSGCTTVESVVIEGSDSPLTMGNNVFLGNPISTVSINRDIAGAPFKGSGIQRLTLGDKITAIYESAFQGCVSLAELTLPSSLKSIGNYAFNGCTSLTEISIPSSVTSLGTQAFGGTQIATARLEDGTEPLSCGNLTFKDCPLTTLYIGRNMTGSPFAGHTGLTDLTFGENLETIANRAFQGCTGLTNLTFGKSLNRIGAVAFSGCTGLTELTIPASVTFIGNNAFENCKSITEVTIPYTGDPLTCDAGVFYGTPVVSATVNRAISGAPFRNCQTLESVSIGNNLPVIDDFAFQNCTKLSAITFPDALSSIGQSAFQGCVGLTEVTLKSDTRDIGDQTFEGCTNITKVTLGKGLDQIGYQAFANCGSLAEINLTEIGVGSIGEESFMNCTSLPATLTLSGSTTLVGARAFKNCSRISSVHLTAGTTEMVLGDNAFEGTSVGTLILERDFSGTAFANNAGLTSLTMRGDISGIPDGAFTNCTGLKSYTVESESLSSIGARAFQNCSGLAEVIIPATVRNIGDYAFAGVNPPLPASSTDQSTGDVSDLNGVANALDFSKLYDLTDIGEGAFQGWHNLKLVYFGPAMTALVHGSAFTDCPNLNKIIIPENLSEIADGYFATNPIDTVLSLNQNPPFIYDNTFSETSFANAKVKVPEGTENLYKADPVWSRFKDLESGDGGVTGLDVPAGAAVAIVSADGCLKVTGLNDGDTAEAYATDGALTARGKASAGEVDLMLPKGVYVVRINGAGAWKAAVK